MGKNKKLTKPDPKAHLLLGIKRDEEEIKKYEKLLKIKKRKNKSKIDEIFQELDPVSNDEGEDMPSNGGDVDDVNMDIDEDDVSIECDDIDEEIDDIEECSQDDDDEASNGKEENMKIKRNILSHLNRLCETQMMKCLDGIEDVWNEYPRGEVRDVFIKESMSYMKLSCIDLAAFVASLHVRLIKQTNLIAFYTEHLVDHLTSFKPSSWINESTLSSVTIGYKFIAYLTRLEMIDSNFILDLMQEIAAAASLDIPQLKVLTDIASIVGFFVRKCNAARCDEFVAAFGARIDADVKKSSEMSEIRSLSRAVVDKLTTSKAKNDIMFDSIVKYRKLIRTWAKKSMTCDNVALRLADFRGENRVRWWLVGSAVNPNVMLNKTAAAVSESSTSVAIFTDQDKQWNTLAIDLGFSTEGKQALFRALMRARSNSDQQDDISEAMLAIQQLSQSSGAKNLLVSESEMVAVIVRCLALEKDFCQVYASVLAGLVESHRRFRQLVKCAMWDILAQPKLVESARHNCGRCLGQLIAAAEFPVNCLKKYNFLDDSPANIGFMTAVMSEIVEEGWDDIVDILDQMSATISTKFVNNLRLFLKKNFKTDDKWGKAVLFKVAKCIDKLDQLRKNVE